MFTFVSRCACLATLSLKAMNRRDVSKLRMLQQEEPPRLSKLIRTIWPEIRAAIVRGHSLKVIRNRLEEIGISIRYNTLAVYVNRLRREDKSRRGGESASREEKNRTAARDVREGDEGDAAVTDPLANVRD